MKTYILWMSMASLTLFATGCISQIQDDGAEFARAIEAAQCLEQATESGECTEGANNRFYLDDSEVGESETQPQLERTEPSFRNVHSDVL